jgi:cell division protein YceG involved in septum cleavage
MNRYVVVRNVDVELQDKSIGLENAKRKAREAKELFDNYIIPIAFFMVIIFAIIVIAVRVNTMSNQAEDFKNAETETIIVQKGETLWSIAGALEFEGIEIRDIVHRISDLNNITNAEIQAGQELIIPVSEE